MNLTCRRLLTRQRLFLASRNKDASGSFGCRKVFRIIVDSCFLYRLQILKICIPKIKTGNKLTGSFLCLCGKKLNEPDLPASFDPAASVSFDSKKRRFRILRMPEGLSNIDASGSCGCRKVFRIIVDSCFLYRLQILKICIPKIKTGNKLTGSFLCLCGKKLNEPDLPASFDPAASVSFDSKKRRFRILRMLEGLSKKRRFRILRMPEGLPKTKTATEKLPFYHPCTLDF